VHNNTFYPILIYLLVDLFNGNKSIAKLKKQKKFKLFFVFLVILVILWNKLKLL
jgi:hypothetical protein